MSVLGLDIGTSSLKVVEIDKQKDKAVLTNWAIFEIPPDLRNKHPEREHFQADILKKFIAKSSAKSVVIVVGGLDVVCKIITLPPLNAEEAVDAVKWQLKDEIPFKVEEGIFSFYTLPGPSKDKINYMVVVAKEDLILRSLQTVNLAGIKPLSIIPVSEALFYPFQSDLQQEGVVCLLSMGQFLSNISFYSNGTLQFSRDVPIGSDDITRAMTSILVSDEGRLELDYGQAEKIRILYGVPTDLGKYPKLEHIPIAHLQAVIRPALERIEEEITRTIEYYRNKINDANIKKIIFTGSASQTPNLEEYLGASIGITFETVDIFKKVSIREDIHEKEELLTQGARLSAAMGAVLAGKGRINLIPKEYTERWKMVLAKYITPLRVGGILLSVLIIFGLVLIFNISSLEEEKNKITEKVNEALPKMQELEVRLKSTKEQAERIGFFKSIEKQQIKLADVLVELSQNVPAEAMLEEINVDSSSEALSLRGLAFAVKYSAENNLSRLVKKLSGSTMFSDVELVNAGLGLDYSLKNFKFEIKSRIMKK